MEYYGTWDGYRLPPQLSKQITKDEAEAPAARGSAYLIGYYDAEGKFLRVVKMYRGSVFFEHVYSYYPSRKLKSVKVTNTHGAVTVREYGEPVRVALRGGHMKRTKL